MLLFIGFLFTLAIFAGVSLLSGAAPLIFIDAPSVLLLLVPLIFFCVTSKNGRILGRYIAASFKKDHAYTQTELEELRAAVKNTIKFTLATGGFVFLTGLVACLGYLGALEKLGPTLAISLLTPAYSITTSYFVLFPVQAWAENKIIELKRGG